MKTCCRCNDQKPMTPEHFHRWSRSADGFRNWCKLCDRKTGKKYREENYEKERERLEKYRTENRDTHLESKRKNNKKRRAAMSDDEKLAQYIRSRTANVIKKGQTVKKVGTLELLGCSIDFLKQHLAERFKPGMNWENYGAWEIDHIRPCASFDLTDPAQQRECFHYTNLQPLWREENRAKGAKWEGRKYNYAG